MSSVGAARARAKFLRFFPDGFADETYLDWERSYKADAHAQWQAQLSRRRIDGLLDDDAVDEVASRAIRIESRTNLLFSFEKMAVRDATRTAAGARAFAEGLREFLHGRGTMESRFGAWCGVVAGLPRRQTRVFTWPVVTVFGFLAQPDRHMFLKPNVTRVAAAQYGVSFDYLSRPNWNTYRQLLVFAERVRHDIGDLQPRDMIDLQSFIWVQGSDEYRGRSFRPAHTTRLRSA